MAESSASGSGGPTPPPSLKNIKEKDLLKPEEDKQILKNIIKSAKRLESSLYEEARSLVGLRYEPEEERPLIPDVLGLMLKGEWTCQKFRTEWSRTREEIRELDERQEHLMKRIETLCESDCLFLQADRYCREDENDRPAQPAQVQEVPDLDPMACRNLNLAELMRDVVHFPPEDAFRWPSPDDRYQHLRTRIFNNLRVNNEQENTLHLGPQQNLLDLPIRYPLVIDNVIINRQRNIPFNLDQRSYDNIFRQRLEEANPVEEREYPVAQMVLERIYIEPSYSSVMMTEPDLHYSTYEVLNAGMVCIERGLFEHGGSVVAEVTLRMPSHSLEDIFFLNNTSLDSC